MDRHLLNRQCSQIKAETFITTKMTTKGPSLRTRYAESIKSIHPTTLNGNCHINFRSDTNSDSRFHIVHRQRFVWRTVFLIRLCSLFLELALFRSFSQNSFTICSNDTLAHDSDFLQWLLDLEVARLHSWRTVRIKYVQVHRTVLSQSVLSLSLTSSLSLRLSSCSVSDPPKRVAQHAWKLPYRL